MSTPFSDIVNKKGLIQLCEDWCGFSDGDISGNPLLLQKFTSWINLGLDDTWNTILLACSLGGLDDSNYSDYPFFSTNLISGQRDYSYTIDGDGSVILDCSRVMVANTAGTFAEIYPVNQDTTTANRGNPTDTTSFIDGRNASGIPTRYSKQGGNSILLDVIPNYNSTNGLIFFGTREASYFNVNDTTKRPGFVGIFQSYPALFASEMYAGMKTLGNLKKLNLDKTNMKRDIQVYYTQRDKDVPKRMNANVEQTR